MGTNPIRGNESELEAIRAIAEGGSDTPVLMLNLNRYFREARFPDGENYRGYMSALDALLPKWVGGFCGARPCSVNPSANSPSTRF